MKRVSRTLLLVLLFLSISIFNIAFAEQSIIATKVDSPPVIDGDIHEKIWDSIKPISVKDRASGSRILLRSVYSEDKVYFAVMFPDKNENSFHKPWIWNKGKESYEEGAHREDTFVFKWNMMNKKVNLSNFSDDNYMTDIWYWKANRTNPAGFADDKTQELSNLYSEKSTELVSTTGKKRFLTRRSDQGKPAYNEFKPTSFKGSLLDRYPKSTPEGSRANVNAKGKWQGGFWTIEFERKLDTGHSDDVQFYISKEYLFGVSIFSLYGKPHDPNSPNLYGRGRISEPLLLSFEQ